MFCMSCGTKLPDDAAFCYKCGNKTASAHDESTSKFIFKDDPNKSFMDNYIDAIQRAYPQPVNKERMDTVLRAILVVIKDALQSGQLHVPENADIADYVLKHTEGITQEWQIVLFLYVLSEKWPIFKDLNEELKPQ